MVVLSPEMFIMKLYVFGSPMAFILLFTFIHFSAVRFHLPKREPPEDDVKFSVNVAYKQ